MKFVCQQSISEIKSLNHVETILDFVGNVRVAAAFYENTNDGEPLQTQTVLKVCVCSDKKRLFTAVCKQNV